MFHLFFKNGTDRDIETALRRIDNNLSSNAPNLRHFSHQLLTEFVILSSIRSSHDDHQIIRASHIIDRKRP